MKFKKSRLDSSDMIYALPLDLESSSTLPSKSMNDISKHQLERLRRLANILDAWVEIPVLRFRVGLDGLLGLIPGFGDFAGLLISLYFVWTAFQAKVPNVVLARMLLNVGTDSLLGSIPLLGDVFDLVFKANRKNLELLERHHQSPQQTKTRSAWFLALAAGLVLVCALMAMWVFVIALGALWEFLVYLWNLLVNMAPVA